MSRADVQSFCQSVRLTPLDRSLSRFDLPQLETQKRMKNFKLGLVWARYLQYLTKNILLKYILLL